MRPPRPFPYRCSPTDEPHYGSPLARSRLGCQVKVTPALAGMRITLPAATRNVAVDKSTKPNLPNALL